MTTYRITSDQGKTVKTVQGQRAAEQYIRSISHKSYSVEQY